MLDLLDKEYSLADFLDFPHLDMMGRAREFDKMRSQFFDKRHFQYKRVALNASSPVRVVRDTYTDEKREMLYFASNDYLNLTKHPRVVEAGKRALEKYGAGAGSVPLLGGTTDIHTELEEKIARFKGCESAIIHTSGYGANSSTILSLLGESDIAIVDMYAHASLIDGCKNTNLKYFRHNDMSSLENILKNSGPSYRTKLIIIDGVYSMDGDICPLDQVVLLAKKYGAYVMVDEAHATGVIGDNGRGTPEHFNLLGQVDIVCGTFSKALGSVGGFIASNKHLINLLNFYSRGYMFSTAMTPQSVGSLIEALNVIEYDPERRNRLWQNIRHFRQGLLQLGFNIGKSETAIFPIIIGNDKITKEICRDLHDMNIYVNPVLYPAVPKRLSRIRLSIMSEHSIQQLNETLDVLEILGRKYNLI